jgi:D-alanine-D-alanine ligase
VAETIAGLAISESIGAGKAAGKDVLSALRSRGHEAVLLELGRDVDVALRALKIQVAFLASRGRTGEDGSVQGLLELLGIPYTGSDVLASALSLDCHKARMVLRQHNLPTPPSYLIAAAEDLSDEELFARNQGFGYPAVVRPRHDNPRCLPCAVSSDDELVRALLAVRRFDDDAIVERHGTGRTIAVAILDEAPIAALELQVKGHLDPAQLLHAAEDETGRFAVGLPRLSPERLRGVTELSVRAAAVMGCTGPTRVDVLVSDRGNEVVLSVNPRPSLSPRSLVGRAAQSVGLGFPELVDRVLQGARLHGRRPRDAELCGPPLDRRAEDLPSVIYNGADRRVVPMNAQLAVDREVV